LTADLQRQYFEELQIQFQPGVGTTGVSVNLVNNDIVIDTDEIYPISPNDTVIISSGTIDPQTVTTNPQAMLRWSSDGGSTWSNEHWTSIGQLGKYTNRAIWRRLGWSRDRVFEVSVSDPVKAVIVSANLKMTAGEN
jgi:hypothetical protein